MFFLIDKQYLFSVFYVYRTLCVVVDVAQLVRAPDCGPGGRRFKPGLPPQN